MVTVLLAAAVLLESSALFNYLEGDTAHCPSKVTGTLGSLQNELYSSYRFLHKTERGLIIDFDNGLFFLSDIESLIKVLWQIEDWKMWPYKELGVNLAPRLATV